MQAWKTHFDERELKEIEYCQSYLSSYNHGTDGHLPRTLIAKLANLLDGGLVPHLMKDVDLTKPVDISKKPAGFA